MAQELRAIGKKIDLALPVLLAPDHPKTAERIIEFFTAQIRTPTLAKPTRARPAPSLPGAQITG